MNKKFDWNKVNKSRLADSRGTYNYKDESKHNENIDNLWKKKFKGKFKSFFDKWDKEKGNY